MNRLTVKKDRIYYPANESVIFPDDGSNACRLLQIIGKYEDLEEELGIDLITLFKALKDGIYYKNIEIYYCHNIVMVGKYFVEVKPIYAVKETTIESCYYKTYTERLKFVDDAHYWDWKTCKKWELKDYKKTWALNRSDLEND